MRHYLAADLALACDSDEYVATRSTAFVFIAVWPIGAALLYAALLWASRGALVKRIPSPLSQATAFLSGGLGHAFWWEPVEMCRKLVLTGWVALIQNDAEQARVLLALVVSIALLVVRVAVKPLKRCAQRLVDESNAAPCEECCPVRLAIYTWLWLPTTSFRHRGLFRAHLQG
eukprot:997089-Prymnesium_polylepis.1